MGNVEFETRCKEELLQWYNNTYRHTYRSAADELKADEVYVVWMCKTLQNNKALLATTRDDGLYFECTYNGDKNELYFDAYSKIRNMAISYDD